MNHPQSNVTQDWNRRARAHEAPPQRTDHYADDVEPDHTTIASQAVARMDPRLDLWTRAFAVCADPTRLKLLIALHAAPEATVSQLAVAVESTPNTVTQALRKLYEAGVTEPRSQGRHRRWRLIDERIHELLHHVAAPHSVLHPDH